VVSKVKLIHRKVTEQSKVIALVLKVRAIFFDLGGTLLKLRRDRIFQIILEDQRIDVPLRPIHDAYYLADAWWEDVYGSKVLSGEEEEKAFRELDLFVLQKLGLAIDRVKAELLATMVHKRWFEVERTIQQELYQDVQPYLHNLRSRGFILGLISNASPETKEIISKVGLDDYMDHIVISGIVGVAKPHPAIFQHAVSLTSAIPDECLHVGNSYKADVLGARRAGLRAVLIDRDGRYPEADCPRIRRLDELDSFLT